MSNIEVIAEAGSNHNGDLGKAIELIDIAKESGASSVKFQFIFADGLYLPMFLKDRKSKIYSENSVFFVRKAEELTESEWGKIWSHAASSSLEISASVFCSKGVSLLKSLGASFVKIASTDFTNTDLIQSSVDSFERVIISTGMASLEELKRNLSYIDSIRTDKTKIDLMHCVSRYPCPLDSSNLARIKLLRDICDYEIGYSDHTEGSQSALIALTMGVRIFEKHFTMDKGLPGFDHKHAANPSELRDYIAVLQDGQSAASHDSSSITKEEEITKIRARRGIYTSRELKKGEKINEEDLLYVRPSSRSSLTSIKDLIGFSVPDDIPKYAALDIIENGIKEVESNWEGASQYWSDEMKEKKMATNKNEE